MLPNLNDLAAEAERTVVRRAIWSMPRKWLLLAIVATVAAAYFFGHR